jgi:LSD1 subclass zinc finger protein
MTAPETVEVVCPECRNTFMVPDGAPETTCPQCSEHIVWRRCLDTDEVFPVLTKWSTWIHPGCESVHVVDLAVKVQPPADAITGDQPPPPPPGPPAAPADPQQAAPFCLIENAKWIEQDLSGQLMIDPVAFGIAGASAGPVAIAWTRDVLDYTLNLHPSAEDGPKKGFGRRKKDAAPPPVLLVVTSRGGTHTVTGFADIDALRTQLEQRLRPVIQSNKAS